MTETSTETLPLVSIITPVYNGAKYLEELIRSVYEQDYPRIEHIIIDDGSTDNGATVEILKCYPHLRWWSRPNKGAYATMNEGLAAAQGDVFTIINADDKYPSPQTISSAVQYLLKSPGYDGIYGGLIRIDQYSKRVAKQPPTSGPLWLFPYYPVMAHSTLFLWQKAWQERGIFFDLSFPMYGDMDWLLRLIHSGLRFRRIKEDIAFIRLHTQQRGLKFVPEEWKRLLERHRIRPIYMAFGRYLGTLIKAKNYLFNAGILEFAREAWRWCKGQQERVPEAVKRIGKSP
jgi:glycosyltransferase involved in cell wall biosynthesis